MVLISMTIWKYNFHTICTLLLYRPMWVWHFSTRNKFLTNLNLTFEPFIQFDIFWRLNRLRISPGIQILPRHFCWMYMYIFMGELFLYQIHRLFVWTTFYNFEPHSIGIRITYCWNNVFCSGQLNFKFIKVKPCKIHSRVTNWAWNLYTFQ